MKKIIPWGAITALFFIHVSLVISQNNSLSSNLIIEINQAALPSSPANKKLPTIIEWHQAMQGIDKAGPSGNLRLLGYKSKWYDDISMVWYEQDSLRNIYDPITYLLNEEHYLSYNILASSWQNANRYLRSYTNGLLTEMIFQYWSGSAWENSQKYQVSYNSNHLVEEEISYVWNGTSWVNNTKLNYTYTGQNLPDSTIHSQWNTLTNTWNPLYMDVCQYDANGNLIQQIFHAWSGSTWTYVNKFIQFFNNNNLYLGGRFYNWNSMTNQWENASRDTVIFYSSTTSITTSYNWNPVTLSWDNDTRILDTYNSSMLINERIAQEWDHSLSFWMNQNKYIYTYNSQENLSTYTFQSWNDGMVQWVNIFQEEYEYNSENYEALYKYKNWDNFLNDWKETYLKYYWYEADPLAFIEEISISEGTIYPNPCSDVLYINLNNLTSEQCQIRLYNLNGQELLNELKFLNSQASLSIQVSNLQPGVYILQIINDGKNMVKKVIKS